MKTASMYLLDNFEAHFGGGCFSRALAKEIATVIR